VSEERAKRTTCLTKLWMADYQNILVRIQFVYRLNKTVIELWKILLVNGSTNETRLQHLKFLKVPTSNNTDRLNCTRKTVRLFSFIRVFLSLTQFGKEVTGEERIYGVGRRAVYIRMGLWLR
jgi:hypothetical protein